MTVTTDIAPSQTLAEILEMQCVEGREGAIKGFFSHPIVTEIDSIEKLCKATQTDYNKYFKGFTPSTHQLNYFKVVALPYYYPELAKFKTRLLAVAGSGKSTCIFKAIALLPESLSAGVVCFNKRIAKEWNEKLDKMHLPQDVYCNNLHSIGYEVLRRNMRQYYSSLGYEGRQLKEISALKVDGSKLSGYLNAHASKEICGAYAAEAAQNGEVFDISAYKKLIVSLVNFGRCYQVSKVKGLQGLCKMYDLKPQKGEVKVASNIIREMTQNASTIDFADMLWMPLVYGAMSEKKFNKPFVYRQFDIVFVDEAQDLSKTQRNVMLNMVKPGGLVHSVGDEKQVITSFAGSDANSFHELGTLPNCIDLPLTISFRCPRGTEKLFKEHVDYFKTFPKNAVLPRVDTKSFEEVKDGDFILCRFSAPLIQACLHYIKEGRKATIRGKEIAGTIISFMKRFSRGQGNIETMLSKMWKHYDKQLTAYAKERSLALDEAAESLHMLNIEMMIQSVEALGSECTTVGAIGDKLRAIFSNENSEGVTLMTCHKAKGLESDNVFLLRTDKRMRTTNATEREQEKNLQYVAKTRHMKSFSYLHNKELM